MSQSFCSLESPRQDEKLFSLMGFLRVSYQGENVMRTSIEDEHGDIIAPLPRFFRPPQ